MIKSVISCIKQNKTCIPQHGCFHDKESDMEMLCDGVGVLLEGVRQFISQHEDGRVWCGY